MNDTLLQDKITALPDALKVEVEDFIDFILAKKGIDPNIGKPVFGSGKGIFKMKPDFNEPLEDFNEYM